MLTNILDALFKEFIIFIFLPIYLENISQTNKEEIRE